MRNHNKGIMGSVPLHYTGYTNVKYTFRCRVGLGNMEILGVTPLPENITSVEGYVIGVNSPKPPRATKKGTTGSISSYCDSAKTAALITEGWRVRKGKPGQKPHNSALSQSFFITINGIKYAWHSAKSANQPAVTELGVEPATVETPGLIWGASFPKPARGVTTLTGGNAYSTYCSPTLTEAPANWQIVSGRAAYTPSDLATYATPV